MQFGPDGASVAGTYSHARSCLLIEPGTDHQLIQRKMKHLPMVVRQLWGSGLLNTLPSELIMELGRFLTSCHHDEQEKNTHNTMMGYNSHVLWGHYNTVVGVNNILVYGDQVTLIGSYRTPTYFIYTVQLPED